MAAMSGSLAAGRQGGKHGARTVAKSLLLIHEHWLMRWGGGEQERKKDIGLLKHQR